ncbi:MAG TPA: redoxin family protein [Blastocatellia bacterium]|jgi:thiol-disulfide isomerase/thioredoxin|nr:redoxin family protein [Blastocatellia bacterium]
MKSELLIASRRMALRRSVIACLLIISGFGVAIAQGKGYSCDPSPDVKAELKKIDKVGDEDLLYKQRRERQLAMLQELLKKHPDDYYVRKRYLDTRNSGFDSDKDALIAEYRAQMEQRPNDPAAAYLYSRLIIGRNTKEAIEKMEKLIANSPEFPQPYIGLAQIYTYPNFRDAAKSKENLKKWMAKCPESTAALQLLSRSDDKELTGEFARKLRARLESSTDPDDINNYDNLWTLEFKLKPVPEHAQVRQQIAEDLKRLRAKNLNTKEWLSALQAGYKMAGDKEGRRWAEDEMSRLFPKSSATKWMIQGRWRDENPYPKPEDPPEKKQAYYQATLKATDEWIKLWPDDASIWSSRFSALSELENTTDAEVEAAGERFLKATEKSEGDFYMIPPVTAIVARTYAKRNIATDRIPSLLQKGLAEIERMEKRSGVDDLYPRGEGDSGGNLRYVRWMSWPILAEAYAKLKQPEKAREVLAQMSEALKKEMPGDKAKQGMKASYANDHVTYWQTTGKVAEAEGRKLDAFTSYQTALSFRPKSATPKSGKKDEMADNAQRLWKELGGTDEGWNAHLARNEAAKGATEATEAATWDSKSQALPDFALTDLRGKSWKLADLKGKVAFINLWATWCGPCKMELPYVQKLSDQMKDRKDVLVLTLNIDDEIGLVEPFMKESKYSFTVIPAQAYAEGLGVYSIPRNWVVSVDGVLTLEGIGFGGEGDEWMKKATEMIEKVKGGK